MDGNIALIAAEDLIVRLSCDLPSLWITATQNEDTPDKAAAWRSLDAIEHFVLHADATTLEGAAAQLVLARNLLGHMNPEDAQDDPDMVKTMKDDLDSAKRAIFSALCVIQKAADANMRELVGLDYFTLEELTRLGCPLTDEERARYLDNEAIAA